jgi:hypothetical protein
MHNHLTVCQGLCFRRYHPVIIISRPEKPVIPPFLKNSPQRIYRWGPTEGGSKCYAGLILAEVILFIAANWVGQG